MCVCVCVCVFPTCGVIELNFWSSLFDSNLCWIQMEFRVVVVVATLVIFIFPHFGMYGIRTHAHRLLSGRKIHVLFNER